MFNYTGRKHPMAENSQARLMLTTGWAFFLSLFSKPGKLRLWELTCPPQGHMVTQWQKKDKCAGLLTCAIPIISLPSFCHHFPPQRALPSQHQLYTVHTSNPAAPRLHIVAHAFPPLVSPFPFLATSKLYLETEFSFLPDYLPWDFTAKKCLPCSCAVFVPFIFSVVMF